MKPKIRLATDELGLKPDTGFDTPKPNAVHFRVGVSFNRGLLANVKITLR